MMFTTWAVSTLTGGCERVVEYLANRGLQELCQHLKKKKCCVKCWIGVALGKICNIHFMIK